MFYVGRSEKWGSHTSTTEATLEFPDGMYGIWRISLVPTYTEEGNVHYKRVEFELVRISNCSFRY